MPLADVGAKWYVGTEEASMNSRAAICETAHSISYGQRKFSGSSDSSMHECKYSGIDHEHVPTRGGVTSQINRRDRGGMGRPACFFLGPGTEPDLKLSDPVISGATPRSYVVGEHCFV